MARGIESWVMVIPSGQFPTVCRVQYVTSMLRENGRYVRSPSPTCDQTLPIGASRYITNSLLLRFPGHSSRCSVNLHLLSFYPSVSPSFCPSM